MNHNPYNFKIGDECILDEEFGNVMTVVIDRFTPKYMYATIHAFLTIPHEKNIK